MVETEDKSAAEMADRTGTNAAATRSSAAKKVRYSVFERIGTGGMATVHRASERHADGTARTVAIKRLWPHLAEDDEFTRSFVREARLAAQLDHPNIVRIHKLGRGRTGYFIAMEHVAGRDLCKILKRASQRSSTTPIAAVLSLLGELCAAIDYAHRRTGKSGKPLGLIHRDISPANLLVDDEGHLKIIDFGIAKATSSNEQTRTGLIKGKYSYMSPEAITGKQLDARSDLFSIGVVAHEMLTARPLFARGNDYQTIKRIHHTKTAPPSLSNHACPPELDAIVLKALATDPDERWQSAAEMHAAIASVREHHAPHASPADVILWLEALRAEPEEAELEIVYEEVAPDPAAPPLATKTTATPLATKTTVPDQGAPAAPLRPTTCAIGAKLRPPRFALDRQAAITVAVVAALAAGVLLVPRLHIAAAGAGYAPLAATVVESRAALPPEPTVEAIELVAPPPLANAPAQLTAAPAVTARRRHKRQRASRASRSAVAAAPAVESVAALATAARPPAFDLVLAAPPATPTTRKRRAVVVPAHRVAKLSGPVPSLVTRDQRSALPKRVSAKLCISDTGTVTSVVLLTTLPADIATKLEAALAAWRYRPYREDGREVPACLAVSFKTSSRR